MDSRRRCAGEPLLRDHTAFRADGLSGNADPGMLKNHSAPGKETCARAGDRMVAKGVEGQPASPGLGAGTAMRLEQRQAQAQAASKGNVHEVRRHSCSRVCWDGVKPGCCLWP